jgi:tRNA 2-thiocytidine biosynthesis protein TtcA
MCGDNMEKYREIEKSIIKKFRKTIWSRFIRAIKDYQLIEENDKIAVCISGGKDSMLLAKCMQELQRHGQFNFELEFILMDPGYNEESRSIIAENSKLLNIPINSFNTDIFKVIEKHGGKSPCYLCARMRRGYLYNQAKELGCNKIALAHHFNDVIETIMLNILYNGRYATMMPKLNSKNFAGMEIIRPFYYIKEEDINAWVKYNDLAFIKCGCVVTSGIKDSKRNEIKELIKSMLKTNENADINILKSSENVNINTIIGYQDYDESHHFLNNYKQ